MKIVIDIPEENYISCLTSGYARKSIYTDLVYAIRNGTQLPKGHGKLVDVEDVKDNIRKWKGYLDEDMMGRINFAMDNHIPTIIDADKE